MLPILKHGCGCGCNANPTAQRPTTVAQRSATGGALTLLGLLGWLCIPKCPLCLAAYVALGSGLTVSLATSQALRQGMWVIAAGFVLSGTWRLIGFGRDWRWRAA